MQTGSAGIRSAMYGEMAASAAGYRPWSQGRSAWEAAIVGASRFLLAAGFDERMRRDLFQEAAATRAARKGHERNRSAVEMCDRLAAEFRWQVRQRSV